MDVQRNRARPCNCTNSYKRPNGNIPTPLPPPQLPCRLLPSLSSPSHRRTNRLQTISVKPGVKRPSSGPTRLALESEGGNGDGEGRERNHHMDVVAVTSSPVPPPHAGARPNAPHASLSGAGSSGPPPGSAHEAAQGPAHQAGLAHEAGQGTAQKAGMAHEASPAHEAGPGSFGAPASPASPALWASPVHPGTSPSPTGTSPPPTVPQGPHWCDQSAVRPLGGEGEELTVLVVTWNLAGKRCPPVSITQVSPCPPISTGPYPLAHIYQPNLQILSPKPSHNPSSRKSQPLPSP